jgi:hypothetical protein
MAFTSKKCNTERKVKCYFWVILDFKKEDNLLLPDLVHLRGTISLQLGHQDPHNVHQEHQVYLQSNRGVSVPLF